MCHYKPLFRYPGGKHKLLKVILAELLRLLRTNKCSSYREPFFGGGIVGCNLLARLKGGSVWINDLDLSLSSIWDCIIKYPDDLKIAIQEFSPSVEKFWECRTDLPKGFRMKWHHFDAEQAFAEYALQKLAVHQMSYSGLGTMAGGPLGGKNQTSKYKINSRWSAARLIKRIDELHILFSRFEISSGKCTFYDFEEILQGTEPALIYLDPPYYEMGSVCYEKAFSPDDHRRLATRLRSTPHHWVLSYDDCPDIHQLYHWARIQKVPVTYSLGHGSTKKTSELLITKE